MARVTSSVFRSSARNGEARRYAQRVARQVAREFSQSTNDLIERAGRVARERRELLDSIQDESLAQSVGRRHRDPA